MMSKQVEKVQDEQDDHDEQARNIEQARKEPSPQYDPCSKDPSEVVLSDRLTFARDAVRGSGIPATEPQRWSWFVAESAIIYGLGWEASHMLFGVAIGDAQSSDSTIDLTEWTYEEISNRISRVTKFTDFMLGERLVAFVRNEAWDDPYRLARRVLKEYGYDPLDESKLTLRFYRGEFFQWRVNTYVPVSDGDIKAHVTATCMRYASLENERLEKAYQYALKAATEKGGRKPTEPRPVKYTTQTISSVITTMQSLCNVGDDAEMPHWLDGDDRPDPKELASCTNGIVDLSSDSHKVMKCTPNLFTRNGLPFDYDPTATCPTWERFLNDVWGDDPQSIETLQQWFGYLLTPETKYHKMFVVIGPPRSGKGTIARVMKALVGRDNVVAPKLSQLAQSFGLQPLIGKTAAIIGDARVSGRVDQIAISEALISIVGEDSQCIDRKHRDSIQDATLPTRFTIFSNELPSLVDSSGAFAKRLVLLRMKRNFIGQEDLELGKKLESELSGILNWAIAGRKKLTAQRRFIQPKSGKDMLEDIGELSSPITRFVEEKCYLAKSTDDFDTVRVKKEKIYDQYEVWRMNEGIEKRPPLSVFARDLLSAFPIVESKKVTWEKDDTHRTPAFCGIKMLPPRT